MKYLASARMLVVGFVVMLAAGVLFAGGQSALAQTPTTTAYVTNTYSTYVSVVDTATGTVTDNIELGLGEYPVAVALNPAGTYAYVTTEGGMVPLIDTTMATGTVAVIDTSTNTVTDTISVGGLPDGVAVNPAGTYVYVVNTADGTVSVIDTSTNTVTDTITVGSRPSGVAVDPTGSYVYVTNGDDGTVSVIDTSTNAVTDTISVGFNPLDVAFNPAGSYAYVTDSEAGAVSVINTATQTVSDTITGIPGAWNLAFTPDGSKLYVTQDGYSDPSTGQGAVALVDPATDAVTELTDPGLSDTAGIAISADGSFAYIGSPYGGNEVVVLDTSTNTFSYITDTNFASPWDVAMNGTAGPTVPAVLSCGYHAGTLDDDTTHLYTNAAGNNEAYVVAGEPQQFLVDCTLTVNTTISKVKVQGGLTNSGKNVSYDWVKDDTGGTDSFSQNKSGNVFTSSVSTLKPGTYHLEISIDGAVWKSAVGSGTQLSGLWTLSYTDSEKAKQKSDATHTPLTIKVVPVGFSFCTAGSENFSEDAAGSTPTTFAGGTIDVTYGSRGGGIYVIPVGEDKEWAAGTHLLSTGGGVNSITLNFTDPVGSVQLDGEAHQYPYTMTLSAYNASDTLLDSDPFYSDYNARHAFTVSSSSNDITHVTLTLSTGSDAGFWFTNVAWGCNG